MKVNNFKMSLINIILMFLLIIVIFTVLLYIINSFRFLSKNQLHDAIYGKLAIQQSLSNPNTLYKIFYNKDNTFTMATIENGSSIGITTGKYQVISKYNIGYIDVTYLDIKESPHKESSFNKNNTNSVHKTKKEMLGPFIIHPHEKRSGYILEYNSNYSIYKNYMTVFS